jgi:hypothetical protein
MSEVRKGSIADVYKTSKNHLKYFKRYCPKVLEDHFLMNEFCSNDDGPSEEIIITSNRVLFTSKNKNVFFSVRRPIEIQRKAIKQLEVSLLHHTEHQGFVSTKTQFLVLNFVTHDHRKFTRKQWIGSKETEINKNWPGRLKTIEKFSKYFTVVEIGEYESSGGFTSSFGLGVFKPLE